MQTVVCDNAAKAVAGYVSYMKRSGFNQNQLVNSKNAMLNFLRRFINKEIAEKKDDKPEWRTCYWSDGYTPMTWCFTLYLLPQQKIVAIMAFTCKENKPGVKEGRNTVRLTEGELIEVISDGVKMVLKEVALGKDSYQAKPKKGGRLNDWELMHILTTIISSMIADKRVSKEDGEMLLHYALYNNDCYSHVDS